MIIEKQEIVDIFSKNLHAVNSFEDANLFLNALRKLTNQMNVILDEVITFDSDRILFIRKEEKMHYIIGIALLHNNPYNIVILYKSFSIEEEASTEVTARNTFLKKSFYHRNYADIKDEIEILSESE